MNKASDARKVLAMVHSAIYELTEMGVQVTYISNGASITVELSAFDKALKTVSVILFPKDFDVKIMFLRKLIDEVLDGDCHRVIEKFIREYNEKFPF